MDLSHGILLLDAEAEDDICKIPGGSGGCGAGGVNEYTDEKNGIFNLDDNDDRPVKIEPCSF